MVELAADARRLKRRIDYFLSSRRRARHEVRDFIDKALALGPVAILGAPLIRDLAFQNNRHFVAHVELVADPSDRRRFERFVRSEGGRRDGASWIVEMPVWQISVRTLAEMQAQFPSAALHGFADLPAAALFTWDAAAYDVGRRRLHLPGGYFAAVESRILDIHCPHDAGPAETAMRACRLVVERNARLGERLSRRLLECFAKATPAMICAAERALFRHHILSEPRVERIARDLAQHRRRHIAIPFQLPPPQGELPLETARALARP